MKKILLILKALCILPAAYSQSTYFPPSTGNTWDTLSVSSLNWCPDSISALYDFLENEQTLSFILLKDGRIVLEEYFNGHGPDSLYIWYSAGKSLTAMLVGIAQAEGSLDIEDKSSEHLGSGWTSLSPAREDSILIWHQLTMTSGLDESDMYCTDDTCLIYAAPAGSRWVYHNAPYTLLRNVVENATGLNYNTFTWTRIGNKTGMGGFWLPVGYNNFYFSKARDMARYGLLVQNKGNWDGIPVLTDTSFMTQMLNSSQSLNPAYGYLWWLNGKSSFIPPGTTLSFPGPVIPHAPADVYTAAGSQGQFISVSPSEGLVMVRQGPGSANSVTSLTLLDEIWRRILNLQSTTGIDPQATGSLFTVYPNPSMGVIDIAGPVLSTTLIRISDIYGRMVIEQSGNPSVDATQLEPGNYIMSIQDDRSRQTEIIIIH